MMMSMINREQAWELLCEFTKTEGIAQARARRGNLRGRVCAQDPRERSPNGPLPRCCTISIGRFIPRSKSIRGRASRFWRSAAIDEEIRRAILSHANHLGVKRETPLEKTLYALRRAGGIYHCDLIREAAPQRLRKWIRPP